MQETAAPAAALPPAPPLASRTSRPDAQNRLRIAAVALVSVLASFALAGQWRAVGELRHRLDRAGEAQHRAEEQLGELTGEVTSTQAQIDGLFDPVAVVRAAEPSVFTLLAGPWQGSAFVVASDGELSTLVTNFHVVRSVWAAGIRRVVVRADARSFNGTITSVRPDADLAVVEVRASLPVLETNPSTPEIGQPVVAVGSPFGYGGTASTGIVSALRGRYVQFSAPVGPGSSGGPVVEGDGQVIAVTTAKVTGHGAEGLSFGIPIDQVCRLITAAC
jgi:S1-C subfamily serine protease